MHSLARAGVTARVVCRAHAQVRVWLSVCQHIEKQSSDTCSVLNALCSSLQLFAADIRKLCSTASRSHNSCILGLPASCTQLWSLQSQHRRRVQRTSCLCHVALTARLQESELSACMRACCIFILLMTCCTTVLCITGAAAKPCQPAAGWCSSCCISCAAAAGANGNGCTGSVGGWGH
jgi:hypothetical protein